MPTPTPDPESAEQLGASTKESIEKARDLVDAMKVVQEYESTILPEKEPPGLPPEDPGESPQS
jgi:hypothetical protein